MDEKKSCPFCGEEILAVAVKCKHCKSDLDAAPSANESFNSWSETATTGSTNVRGTNWNPISLAKSVHRGEQSLALTYWLWIAVPAALFNAASIALTYNAIYLSTKSVSVPLFNRLTFYQIVTNGLVVVYLCWLTYFGLGVLAIQRKTKTVWASIASLLVVLGFIISIVRYVEALTQHENPTDAANEIATLNAQLPQQIDKVTTLTRIDYSGNVMTYHYTLDGSVIDKTNWGALLSHLHGRDNCDIWNPSFTDGQIIRIDYDYESPVGNVVHTISLNPADCH